MLNIKETNSTESHQQAPTHDQQVPTVETTSKANIKTDQKNTHLAPPQQESLGEAPTTESETASSAGRNGLEDQDQPVESVPGSAKPISRTISPRKVSANRRNAQRSTGPRTAVGKTISSWNSLRHGLLSKRLVEFNDQKAKQYYDLLASLQQDLEPVGALEQVLVEKIAYEYWRQAVAADYENKHLDYLFLEGKGNGIRYHRP